jgi:hypothetical protein
MVLGGMMSRSNYFLPILFLATIFLLPHSPAQAKIRACGPFYLRDAQGDPINPMTGENADKPFSTRQTCGACHDYDRITRGYHFQQGWDRIRDDFDKSKPWVLSDGMMGKQ